MALTESGRPAVFVGSSTTGLDVARAVQQQLQSLRSVAQVLFGMNWSTASAKEYSSRW
jgi:hypothetical protein